MTSTKTFTANDALRAWDQIGIDWSRVQFDPAQLRRGMDVELEHGLRDSATDVTGDDPLTTAKIAVAHLSEFPDYYVRLDRMEYEAEHGISHGGRASLADELLPTFDVSDQVAVVVDADEHTTWDALIDADLLELGRRRPLVGLLLGVRMLPDLIRQRLHGKEAPRLERLTLRDATKLPMSGGGWVLLDERPGEEIALGLVGKFWRPMIEFADVDAAAFKDYAAPGFAKTVYALGTRRIADGKTLVWGLMRTATTDEHARRWFRRYWTLGIGSGAHMVVNGLLDLIRDEAERRSADARATGAQPRRDTSPPTAVIT